MSTKTVLVVDDSKSARFAMRKFLEGFGYQVDAVESAEDAYLYLRKQLPEVMFLDHIMPGTDGFEAIKAIKQNALTAGLPVVLCSSNEGEDFRRQARAIGAIDVMQKPPSPEQIRGVLDNLKRLQESAPPAMLAPAAPNKVQSIREPEVAIEQAVMKNLRDALPAVAAPVAVAAAPAAPAPRLSAPRDEPVFTSRGAPAREELSPRVDQLREEMEARLRKITQDLFVQIAEVKAQLSHVDAARDDEHLRTLAMHAVEPQLDALGQGVEGLLTRLRSDIDDMLAAQNQRIDQLSQSLRQAVIEEAHSVSERVMMNAAQRISDQIAESILRVLKPAAASQN